MLVKMNLMLVFSCLFSYQLSSQCPNLPTSLPCTLQEVEAANFIIAECYAPKIHHLAEDNVTNSANGRADLITSVFYDNMQVNDNWENLANYQSGFTIDHDELDPYVYYSVVWHKDWWFVTYAFYHPRDYSHDDLCCCDGCGIWPTGDNHEHDLEGAILLVSREDFLVKGVSTILHEDIHHQNISSTVNQGIPEIYIDNRNHAVDANIDTNEFIDGDTPVANCDDSTPFWVPHVIYEYTTGSPYVNAVPAPGWDKWLTGTGGYKLEDIFGSHTNSLINQRYNPEVFSASSGFNSFFTENLAGDNHDCTIYGGLASAPWGWSQMDYSYTTLHNLIIETDNAWQSYNPADIEYNPYDYDCGDIGLTLIIEDDTEYIPSMPIRLIRVKSEKTLNIQCRQVNFVTNGKIIMEEGSKLILDEVVITNCSDSNEEWTRWDGIYALEGGAPVEINISNGTSIENSNHGITNTTQLDDNLPNSTLRWRDFPFEEYTNIGGNVTLNIDDCAFINNGKAITIAKPETPTNISISNSDFTNNTYGIGVFHSDNVEHTISKTHFEDNNYDAIYFSGNESNHTVSENEFINMGINSVVLEEVSDFSFTKNYQARDGSSSSIYTRMRVIDSYGSIENQNIFENCVYALSCAGTYPLSSGVSVGNANEDHNSFINNEGYALGIFGNTLPFDGDVANNLFDENEDESIRVFGESEVLIKNNSLENGGTSIWMEDSDENVNLLICNDFVNNDIQEIAFQGQNQFSQAVENVFTGNSSGGNINLYDASINPTQGLLSNPADNCFNSSSVLHINSEGTSDTITYLYADAMNDSGCEEPLNIVGPVNPFDVPFSASRCISFGITQIKGDDPSDQWFIHVDSLMNCPGCFTDSLTNMFDELFALGGDDPRTYLNETSVVSQESILLKTKIHQYINRLVYKAVVNKEFEFAESILSTLKKFFWQKRYFGLLVKSGQYDKASNLLAKMPRESVEQEIFRTTQEINLKRLEMSRIAWTPSQSELNLLLSNISARVPSSAYAWSLYNMLTGIYIDIPIQEPSAQFVGSRFDNNTKSEPVLYPNPSNGNIYFKGLEHNGDTKYVIRNINGVSVQSGILNKDEIDINTLQSGLYFIQVFSEVDILSEYKFVKL